MKTFTAIYTAELGQNPISRLIEECRINVAKEPMNLEQIDETTWFEINYEIDEDEMEPEHFFDTLGRDLSTYLQCEVVLHDVME